MRKLLFILFLLPILSFGQTRLRTGQTTMGSGFVNVMDYIPVSADSSVDVTANIRLAVKALNAKGGGTLYFPNSRQYLTTDSIHFDGKAISVLSYNGMGPFFGGGTGGRATTKPSATILSNSLTKPIFVVNVDGCKFQDIALYNTNTGSTPTAGSAILFNKATSMRMENVSVYYFYQGVDVENGLYWQMKGCHFIGCVTNLLTIRDLAVADEGDQRISDCYFTAGVYANMDGIIYTSGGGLHVDNCKFNWVGGNQMRHCIQSAMTSNTVDLSVTNNSFENFTGYAVSVQPASGVVNSDIIINDNQITPGVSSTSYNIIQLGNTTNAPYNVSVVGNVFHSLIVGSGTGGSATGFNVWSAAPFLTIGSNANVTYNSGGAGNSTYENYYFYSTSNLNLHRQETIYANPTGAGMTYDPANGINQSFTMTTSSSVDFKNCYPSNFKLYLIQDATGGHSITWGTTTTLLFTGSNSVISTAANSVTVISGYYDPNVSKTVLTIENSPDLGTVVNTSAMNALTGMVAGNRVYNTAAGGYFFYTGSAWVQFNALSFTTGFTTTGSVVTNDAITGKSGGQTITGGTASGNALTLRSNTSNNGKINFSGNSAFDEANNWLGIGTLTPGGTFDGTTGTNTTNWQLRLGGLYAQTYSINDMFLMNNTYFGASGPTRPSSGYAVGWEFYNGTIDFIGASGSGSGTWTRAAIAKFDPTLGFGFGSTSGINLGQGDFGGATFYATGTGAFIGLTPTTSAGTYDILTRNTSTKVIEKISSASVPFTQATADLTAQTTAGNVTTFTVGTSTATFNISGYINITAVTVDVIEMQVTYTDENSTSQTANFFTQGATSALLSAIGNSVYPPMTIRAKNGTVITVKTTLTTGTGSISFDAGGRITML